MSRGLRRFVEMEYAVGTDGTITITLKDSAGDPLGVVGASAHYWIYLAVPRRRKKPWTGNAELEKTSVAGEIALTTGQAVVTITNADLGGKSGRFYHMLRVTDSSAKVTLLGGGELFLQGAPT